jgi:hypothetical protein
MKRRLRKKQTRKGLELAVLDLGGNGLGEAWRVVDERHEESYVPSPRYAAEFRRLGVSLRIVVLKKMTDAMWVGIYSPEFPQISQVMLEFWGAIHESVFQAIDER